VFPSAKSHTQDIIQIPAYENVSQIIKKTITKTWNDTVFANSIVQQANGLMSNLKFLFHTVYDLEKGAS
jgi:hypothetical protein